MNLLVIHRVKVRIKLLLDIERNSVLHRIRWESWSQEAQPLHYLILDTGRKDLPRELIANHDTAGSRITRILGEMTATAYHKSEQNGSCSKLRAYLKPWLN